MQKLSRVLAIALVLVGMNMVVVPSLVFAQNTGGTPGGGLNTGGTPAATDGGGLTNPLNSINSLPEFMNAILDAVVELGSIILVLALVYVGFLFVKAQGKEEEIKNARSALMWTVIGGLVLLGAKTVGLVITSTVQAL